jgi:GNAT superfamily N-acetyltransferase
VLSVEGHERLFETDWLSGGTGLALERAGTFGGCGWTRHTRWNGRNYIHIGLLLGRDFRTPASFQALTDPLLEAAREMGASSDTQEAITSCRSVDTIHPPIFRSIGFSSHPVSMLGFGHDLRMIPLRLMPPGIALRPARLPDEAQVILDILARCYDNPATQGQPMEEGYITFETGRPGFKPEQLLIAEAAGDPVGCAVLLKCGEEPCSGHEIAGLGVLPGLRGRGIGTAIVSQALNWIRVQGGRVALSAAFSTNRATTTYWRMGFRPDPLRTFSFFTRPLGQTDARPRVRVDSLAVTN